MYSANLLFEFNTSAISARVSVWAPQLPLFCLRVKVFLMAASYILVSTRHGTKNIPHVYNIALANSANLNP